MPKHVVILSSQVTGALRGYASHEESLTYLEIPDADEAAVDVILSGINDDNWVKSGTLVLEDGSVSGIMVPKSAGK